MKSLIILALVASPCFSIDFNDGGEPFWETATVKEETPNQVEGNHATHPVEIGQFDKEVLMRCNQFSNSTQTNDVPAYALIDTASLILSFQSATNNMFISRLQSHQVGWREATASWDDFGQFGPLGADGEWLPIEHIEPTVTPVTVTSHCQHWTRNPNERGGWLLYLAGQGTNVVYGRDSVRRPFLVVYYFLAGDANKDDVVNEADWDIWNANKGGPGGWEQGDWNADGQVDDLDEVLWLLAQPVLLPGDFNGNGMVEQRDLDLVLLNWGDDWFPLNIPAWVNDQPLDGKIDQNELDKVLLNWGDTL